MSELIDRSVLKARMYCEAFESDTDMQKWDSGFWIRYKLFEKVVDNMPTVPYSPRWHSMEVEEPTKAGWYLVMDMGGDFNVDEWHNTFGWRFVTPSDADRITHWMPIEPPKEEEA